MYYYYYYWTGGTEDVATFLFRRRTHNRTSISELLDGLTCAHKHQPEDGDRLRQIGTEKKSSQKNENTVCQAYDQLTEK